MQGRASKPFQVKHTEKVVHGFVHGIETSYTLMMTLLDTPVFFKNKYLLLLSACLHDSKVMLELEIFVNIVSWFLSCHLSNT